MISSESAPFNIPDGGGPIEMSGHYQLNGSLLGGYSMSGRAVYRGVIADGVLILNFGQWYYQGAMTATNPEFPSASNPIRIALDPDATVVTPFNYVHEGQVPCSGKVVYRVQMAPETQIWEVFLSGYRHLIHKSGFERFNPAESRWESKKRHHGVTFTWNLVAEFEITKKDSNWVYTFGRIKEAQVEYHFMQNPKLFTITKPNSKGCGEIESLTGKPIGGAVADNQNVTLLWPNHKPEVTFTIALAAKCRPGATEDVCKGETFINDSDDDFMQRAQGHVLPLREGRLPPIRISNPRGATDYAVAHEYTLKRLK